MLDTEPGAQIPMPEPPPLPRPLPGRADLCFLCLHHSITKPRAATAAKDSFSPAHAPPKDSKPCGYGFPVAPRMPQTKDGPRSICRLNISYTINRGRNDSNYIEVTTWGEAAENHARYLHKGSPVRIDGELDYATWQADDCTNRSRHTVINATIEYLSTPTTKTDGQTPNPTTATAGGGREPF